MVVGQLVMVMVMAMTSLYMVHHGHGLGDVSIVIMAHTLGMYGLSMLTGRLADNLGRPPTIIAGALLLAAGCILAPLSQLTGVLAVALFLLGLGWNFCYVGRRALLTDTLTLPERAGCRAAAISLSRSSPPLAACKAECCSPGWVLPTWAGSVSRWPCCHCS